MTHDDPFAWFDAWMAEAERAEPSDPNAMTLATTTADGWPRARIVLLKGADRRGYVFYTNKESDKGAELAANAASQSSIASAASEPHPSPSAFICVLSATRLASPNAAIKARMAARRCSGTAIGSVRMASWITRGLGKRERRPETRTPFKSKRKV